MERRQQWGPANGQTLPATGSPGLSPKASAVALAAVAACLAILWPRLIAPQTDVRPNTLDKQTGCCDVFVDTDVNAIKVVAEMCSSILQRRGGPIDPKTEEAFLTGRLTKDIIAKCRQEVNTTCGVDIATFLDQNIRLGKSYRQILDEIRSYNNSNCLKTHYGVAPWSLGVPHLVGKFWMQGFGGMRQERPPHLRPTPVHPALRERGRAIVTPTGGAAPSPSPSGPYQASAPFVQRGPVEGRVWSSPLNVYYVDDEPIPIGGIRPPMGGAGGVVPPPKSSVGFVMPLYTLCIVIFFLYTVFKMIFRRQIVEGTQPDPNFKSDPEFRSRVFKEPNRSNRTSPDTNKKLVVNAISGLVAEVRQQMEECHQVNGNATQDGSPRPYTNGSLHHNQREPSPIITQTKDFLKKESTPPSWEDSTPVQEKQPVFSPPKESSQPPEEIQAKTDVPVLKSESRENLTEKLESNGKPVIEEDIVRQVRSSVEKEKATVKVLGMEMTAHCEGGQKWIAPRSPTPPVISPPQRHPTPPVEVSSIYLEGALPHQSRLLVADSETHTEEINDGDEKDAPIVLSGKMTLSVINDELIKALSEKDEDDVNDGTIKAASEKELEDITIDGDDEDFLTASAATAPKQIDGELEESEEEIEEEEIEEEEEEEEIEVEELVEDEKPEATPPTKPQVQPKIEYEEVVEDEKPKATPPTKPQVQPKIEYEEVEVETDEEVEEEEKPKATPPTKPQVQPKIEYEEVEVEVETDEEVEEEEEEEGTDEEAEEIIKIEKANDRT